MSQIVLNGDVIDQNKVYPAIIIDGFDKTFSEDKMETNLIIYSNTPTGASVIDMGTQTEQIIISRG